MALHSLGVEALKLIYVTVYADRLSFSESAQQHLPAPCV